VLYLVNVFKEVKNLPLLKLFLKTTAKCPFKHLNTQSHFKTKALCLYTKAQLLK